MPFTPFSFDDSVGRTEAGRARVPEGYYLVECEGMEPTARDWEKTTGVWNKVRIVSGPDAAPGTGVGGRLRDFNSVGKADAQFGLGQTLGAFGQEPIAKQLASGKVRIDSYEQFERLVANISQRCAGKRAVAFIADQPGTTRPFSGIEALYPEGDWPNYRQAAPLGAVIGPRTPGPMNGGAAVAMPEGVGDLFSDLEQSV